MVTVWPYISPLDLGYQEPPVGASHLSGNLKFSIHRAPAGAVMMEQEIVRERMRCLQYIVA